MSVTLPDLNGFLESAEPGTIVTVARRLYSDTETPISIFKKVCETSSHAFLLESVEGGENLARYSFLGLNPQVTIKARGNRIEFTRDGKLTRSQGNPVEFIKTWMSRFRPVHLPGLPRFQSGVVGYFSYDTVGYFENIPRTKPDPLELPDCYLMVPEILIVFDHVMNQLTLIRNVFVEEGLNTRELYDTAVFELDFVERRISEIVLVPRNYSSNDTEAENLSTSSNTTRQEYEAMVEKARKYIYDGDIFQVVLSQRLEMEIGADPFEIYRALRRINPSPYMFYLQLGDLRVAGSSPEVLVRVENGVATNRPIAGTRHRSADPAEDLRLEQELLADPKECSEHVMLVDLGRNDLGRVCRYGTVKVTEQMVVERYSHVMHIVSNVEGILKEDSHALDVLGACFPAGTLSGAPKVRAMEIIDELEKEARGLYGGAVGYIDFSGNCDFCITIRTIVIHRRKAYIQAGAGIVADSVPAREYEETMNKAGALLKAIRQTEMESGR